MKKAVKRRIKALEIGIRAIDCRLVDLQECVEVDQCPLCEAYHLISQWSCDECPAHKKTDDSGLTCDEYSKVIEDLLKRLGRQREKWVWELATLKGVK